MSDPHRPNSPLHRPLRLANGFLMNVEIHENVLARDTLFIHGNVASNRWWEPALKVLRVLSDADPNPRRGRAFLAEWRGNGGSGPPQNSTELKLQFLANDYLLLLDTLGLKKVCVVGHSTGGLIALCAMLKAPERFERAVLLDPVSARGVHVDEATLASFARMSRDRAFCAGVMATTMHGVDPRSEFFQRLVDDAFAICPLNWRGVPEALGQINISEGLKNIPHPVLILHGEFDPVLPVTGSVETAKLLPHGEFRLLTGRGHSANIEDPNSFVDIVQRFL